MQCEPATQGLPCTSHKMGFQKRLGSYPLGIKWPQMGPSF